MKVYLVVLSGPESCSIEGIYKTYEGAKQRWDEVRLNQIENAKKSRDYAKKYLPEDTMYDEMIEKLSCTDPEKIDNYPHETPHIWERQLED